MVPKFWFIVIVLLNSSLLLMACSPAEPETKTFTIGIVHIIERHKSAIESFKAELAARGYVEGENITYIYDGVLENNAAIEPALQALVEQHVDLIFALNTPVNVQARQTVTDIPIVFVGVYDPVGANIVADLQHPGGNITGIRSRGFIPKTLEQLLQISPAISPILVPYNTGNSASVLALEELRETASKLEVDLVERGVATSEELVAELANIPPDVQAIFAPPAMFGFDMLIAVSLDYKLPLIATSRPQVEAGALMSYAPEFTLMGEQAARLADQILKGSRPADLPIETAEFIWIINQQTAQTIGLDLPNEVLGKANEIIR